MQTDATIAMVMAAGREIAGSINKTKLLDNSDKLRAMNQPNLLLLALAVPTMPDSLQVQIRADQQVMSTELLSMTTQ